MEQATARKYIPRKVSTRRCRSKTGDVMCALSNSESWPSDDGNGTGTETCTGCGDDENVAVSESSTSCHFLGPLPEWSRRETIDPSALPSAIGSSTISELGMGGDLALFRGGTTSRFWNVLMGAEMEAMSDLRDLRSLRGGVRRDATYLQCVWK